MNIWFEQPSLQGLNESRSQTRVDPLGICCADMGDGYFKLVCNARMTASVPERPA